MNIQEHLAVFDIWLTGRIDEAHAAGKDLAFRDQGEIRLGKQCWEYSLLHPGQRAPRGDGWSIYRLQGVWPEELQAQAETPAAPASAKPGKRGLMGSIASLFGQDGKKH